MDSTTLPPADQVPACLDAHRPTNSGALRTSAPTVLVDNLSINLPGTMDDAARSLPYFDQLDWIELPRGRYGYGKARRCGNIRIDYEPAEGEPRTRVEWSGQGCREYEAAGLTDWQGFFRYLLDLGATFSRNDWALDDKAETAPMDSQACTGAPSIDGLQGRSAGLLDMDAIEQAARRGHLTSRWGAGRIVEGLDLATGESSGRTIYFGQPASSSMLRIYDKAAEQRAKGKPFAGHWVRVEQQFRDRRAQAAARTFAEHGVAGILGALRGYLEFKLPNESDTNKRRWTPAPWWVAFLQECEKARLIVEPIKRTMEGLRRWLNDAVAPSLALVVAAAQGDLDEVYAMIADGRGRWRSKHRALLVA